MTKGAKRVVFRDSGDGKFVKQKYAETHPKTTERQHVDKPKPTKKGK